MINCIIVEDEPLAVARIAEYIDRVSFLHLMQAFDNAVGVVDYLSHKDVDLMFLDIQMDGFTGIELLETLKKKPQVILTTAYDQYALRGYELNVTDYLLKPFSFQRFLEAVSKVEQRKETQGISPTAPFVFIKNEYRLEKVFIHDILFIEGMGDYRKIHTLSKKIMTLQTFTELEQTLEGRGFCRVHKSFIVSLSKIEFIERDRIKIGDERIPISETYKGNFYKMIS
jgi:DNA-binding LytR/AlgR family response regulator